MKIEISAMKLLRECSVVRFNGSWGIPSESKVRRVSLRNFERPADDLYAVHTIKQKYSPIHVLR